MTRLRLLLLTLVGLPLAVAGWLWLALLSPFTYDPPDDLPAIADGRHEVFVYGTLRSGLVRWVVTGRIGESTPAVLEDFRREGLDLVEAPGARVEGEVIDVSAEELARLDRYERLGLRYERVTVELVDGREVWVYRRLLEEAPSGARLWPDLAAFYNGRLFIAGTKESA
ncbi:gamma-glutamylcyclotransferase [Halomonas sp. EGI 63088]|uniref:Gamma-glutamylcyclotransferase n=1 Tax=Halomonas flagellata TaxID=2920385 RepID=A0ABS9RSL6_9GAMM|nr:gamma-glutamylcyclotransferase family protein [Halomonas flagellata]MCH4562830.1 gamma-glutamylcyclotransferase [Halomonas flagellata]